MNCTSCGAAINGSFCNNCGRAAYTQPVYTNELYCPNCNNQIANSATICPNCNTRFTGSQPEIQMPVAPYTYQPLTGGYELRKPPTNGMAIASLVLSLFLPIVGLIIGIVSLNKISKTYEGGKGLAVAAIVISSIRLVIPFLSYFA